MKEIALHLCGTKPGEVVVSVGGQIATGEELNTLALAIQNPEVQELLAKAFDVEATP